MVYVNKLFAKRLALHSRTQWEQRQLEMVQNSIEQGVCEETLRS